MMNEKQVEALKLALKALKEINSCGYATCWHGAFDTEVVVLMDVLQETNSLGLKGVYTGTHKDCEIKHTIDHYPQPAPKDKQQEPWQGLTDEQIAPIIQQYHWLPTAFARSIEAKLRELNEHREKNA